MTERIYDPSRPFIEQIERREVGPSTGMYKNSPLRIGGLLVSIQAGEFNYSRPRISYPDLTHYTAFEVALMYLDATHRWATQDVVKMFSSHEWALDAGSDDVLGFMSVEDVEQMLQTLTANTCASCGNLRRHHANGACLFDTTSFKPWEG